MGFNQAGRQRKKRARAFRVNVREYGATGTHFWSGVVGWEGGKKSEAMISSVSVEGQGTSGLGVPKRLSRKILGSGCRECLKLRC